MLPYDSNNFKEKRLRDPFFIAVLVFQFQKIVAEVTTPNPVVQIKVSVESGLGSFLGIPGNLIMKSLQFEPAPSYRCPD